jgi:hypothetical protein
MPSGFVFDSAGNLFVNVAVGGGGSGGNVTIAGQSFSPLVVEDLSTNIVGNPATADATQIGFTDGSGNTRIPSATNPLPVNVITGGGANASVSTTGTAVPASATYAGAKNNSGNLTGLNVDAFGNLLVNLNANSFGAIAVTNTGTFVVQESSAMTGTVPGTAPSATDIAGGIYNAASPTPTTGQTLPLQLDISGALKTVSGGPSSTALVTWNSTNGTLNATQAIYSNSTAYANLMLHSVGTGTISGGTFVIQGSDDNANWQTIPVYSIRQAAYITGNISIPTGAIINSYAIQTFGFSYLRILFTAAFVGSGSLTQSYSLSGQSQPVVATNPSIVNQAQATGDVTTALAPLNSLTNNGSLAVTICAALGSTALTNDPGSNSSSQALRTPAIFHNASVSATASGNTAVWTPTSGKKFRLMRFQITAQGLSATAATLLTISFQDGSTGIGIGTYDVLLPAVANLVAGITTVSAWIDLGNGYLSTAANNVLNANISATVTGATGTFRVNVCGTEE